MATKNGNGSERVAQFNEFGEPILYPQEWSRRFTTYRVGIRMRDKLVGGIPNDPQAIEGWIATRMMITDEQAQLDMVAQTLRETGIPVPENATRDEIRAAAAEVAETTHACGFKFDQVGAYLESRCVKAMFKEATNILFAGSRWGPTKKGPKSFVAERAFPWPDRIYLGNRPKGMLETQDDEVAAKFAKAESNGHKNPLQRERSGADGRLLFTGHTTGPKGPVSTLTYYQYVEQARLDFDIMVCDDSIEPEHFQEILEHCQENGLGTLRSQGHGRFNVVNFQRLEKGVPLLGGTSQIILAAGAQAVVDAGEQAASEVLV